MRSIAFAGLLVLVAGCQNTRLTAERVYGELDLAETSVQASPGYPLEGPPAGSPAASWYEVRARMVELSLESERGGEEIERVRRVRLRRNQESFQQLRRLAVPKDAIEIEFETVASLPVAGADRVPYVKVGYMLLERDSGLFGKSDIYPAPTVEVDRGIPLEFAKNLNYFEHVVFPDFFELRDRAARGETGIVETFTEDFEFYDSALTPERAHFLSVVEIVLLD
jgi:hypothetical protein